MPEYKWPPMKENAITWASASRVSTARSKSAGRAKYTSDLNRPGILLGTAALAAYAHAKIVSIDFSAPKNFLAWPTSTSFKARHGNPVGRRRNPGRRRQHRRSARDAVRAIKVDYEVLPHVVKEQNWDAIPKPSRRREQITGDPDKAFKEADVALEGNYGIPVITHCCLEPHGQSSRNGTTTTICWCLIHASRLRQWPPFARPSGLAARQRPHQVTWTTSAAASAAKFPPDRWGVEAAKLSKEAGGKPVKLFLDRAPELTIAGVRPSPSPRSKLARRTTAPSSPGNPNPGPPAASGGAGLADQLPYVLRTSPTAGSQPAVVSPNTGPSARLARSQPPAGLPPYLLGHDDLAAKLNMDPLEFFMKNAALTVARQRLRTASSRRPPS